jgi:hypothetical protein
MRFWRGGFGRRFCNLISGGQHVFTSWDKAGWKGNPYPLPMAYCERCGVEL